MFGYPALRKLKLEGNANKKKMMKWKNTLWKWLLAGRIFQCFMQTHIFNLINSSHFVTSLVSSKSRKLGWALVYKLSKVEILATIYVLKDNNNSRLRTFLTQWGFYVLPTEFFNYLDTSILNVLVAIIK